MCNSVVHIEPSPTCGGNSVPCCLVCTLDFMDCSPWLELKKAASGIPKAFYVGFLTFFSPLENNLHAISQTTWKTYFCFQMTHSGLNCVCVLFEKQKPSVYHAGVSKRSYVNAGP